MISSISFCCPLRELFQPPVIQYQQIGFRQLVNQPGEAAVAMRDSNERSARVGKLGWPVHIPDKSYRIRLAQ